MIDTALIKENYSRMTDGELIHLAQSEGQDLTPEALTILHDEFLRRKLDTKVFESVADNIKSTRDRKIEQAQNTASNEFTKSIWEYAFEQKANGASNEDIQKGLAAKGLNDESASLILKSLGTTAKRVLDSVDSSMLAGGVICLIGIIITVWTYTSSAMGGRYIIAWGAIIFGAIRFFQALI